MLILVMLVALVACSGSEGGSPSGVVADPLTGARSMELTEPWKSMNLPIDGAVVEASSANSLLLRFPTVPPGDFGAVYAALKEGLIGAGWSVDRERDYPTSRQAVMHTTTAARATLDVIVQDDRPSAMITILD